METPVPWSVAAAEEVIERHLRERGPLLVILHDLQATFGYIDDAALPLLATALNISRAEVHGVVTFYHDFRHAPAGLHTLKMCRAESCQSMGSEALIAHVTAALGIKLGETTADGNLTVEQVFCLGNCALSPAVMLDGRLVGRASEARVDALVADVSGGGR
jgi:formate dehydrogenase subunit gamma